MKRKLDSKNETENQNSKRVKFMDVESIPKWERNKLDFRSFLFEPKIPFDVTIANKTSEFSCHKNILMKVSPVFENILQGDQNASVLHMDDISDKNLKVLQNLIYGNPEPMKRMEILKSSSPTLEDIVNIILLVSKYDVGLIDCVLADHFKEPLGSGEEISIIWNTLKDHNLDALANVVFKTHTQDLYTPESLQGFPIEICIGIARKLRPGRNAYIQKYSEVLKYTIRLPENDPKVKSLKNILKDKPGFANFRNILKYLLN